MGVSKEERTRLAAKRNEGKAEKPKNHAQKRRERRDAAKKIKKR
jgi:hypothetical protein